MKSIDFKGYSDLPKDVLAQIDAVSEIWKKYLKDDLVGVYVQGSIALKRFLASMSDVDLLIVVKRAIPPKERRLLAKEILAVDQRPSPLELSAIKTSDLIPWRHPTNCQFHYSGYHKENYEKVLAGELNEYYILDHDFEDPDIACHATVTRQAGICVYGAPIGEVFPSVPEKDFVQSLCNEIDEYDFYAYEPRYFASNILILGRVLSYLEEKKILSKYDGGVWMCARVPAPLRYIPEDALKVWYEQKTPAAYKEEDLEALRLYLIGEIQKRLRERNA